MDGLAYQTPVYELQTEHSHVIAYTSLGLSLLTVIILLFLIVKMFIHTKANNRQSQGIIPVLIRNNQDLNNALNAYDNSQIDNTVKAGLNQNNQDISQFSQ